MGFCVGCVASLNVADDGLATRMDVHVLDAHHLLAALATLAVQRRQQFDEGSGRARRGLAQPLGGFKRLIRQHRPAAAFN